MDKLVWQEDMISLMNVGQLWGHSCFRMETRTRFSLLRIVRCCFKDSSVPEHCIMKLTTKFRIPKYISNWP